MGLRWLNFKLYTDSQWDCDGSNANYILIVNGTAMAHLRTLHWTSSFTGFIILSLCTLLKYLLSWRGKLRLFINDELERNCTFQTGTHRSRVNKCCTVAPYTPICVIIITVCLFPGTCIVQAIWRGFLDFCKMYGMLNVLMFDRLFSHRAGQLNFSAPLM